MCLVVMNSDIDMNYFYIFVDWNIKKYYVCNSLQAEREERREAAIARFAARRAYTNRLREKNQKLRAQYLALLDS